MKGSKNLEEANSERRELKYKQDSAILETSSPKIKEVIDGLKRKEEDIIKDEKNLKLWPERLEREESTVETMRKGIERRNIQLKEEQEEAIADIRTRMYEDITKRYDERNAQIKQDIIKKYEGRLNEKNTMIKKLQTELDNKEKAKNK